MSIRLEHANLTVHNIDVTIRFIRTALPSWHIRHDETDAEGRPWVHIGAEDHYLALNQASESPAEPWVPNCGKPGVNHLAFEVDDVSSVRDRLRAAGYRDTTFPNAHPHRRRVYFHDSDDNDREFVQYLSERPEERNDYALPDHG